MSSKQVDEINLKEKEERKGSGGDHYSVSGRQLLFILWRDKERSEEEINLEFLKSQLQALPILEKDYTQDLERYQELIKRDKRDMERDADPLKIVKDAVVIDSSDLNIDQVTNQPIILINSSINQPTDPMLTLRIVDFPKEIHAFTLHWWG